MHRFKCIRFVVLLSFLALAGCQDRGNLEHSPTSASTTQPVNGSAILENVFADHNVKEVELTLTKDEVKQRLGDLKQWTDFSIEEIGTGQYEGQATSPKGELLNVEIRQTATSIYARWKNADGSGFGSATLTL